MTTLKLTEEVLGVVAEQLDESPIVPQWTSNQFIDAIRALRDAAQAVVDSVEHGDGNWDYVYCSTIDKLRAVLPGSG